VPLRDGEAPRADILALQRLPLIPASSLPAERLPLGANDAAERQRLPRVKVDASPLTAPRPLPDLRPRDVVARPELSA
jgi:hypothetical protein